MFIQPRRSGSPLLVIFLALVFTLLVASTTQAKDNWIRVRSKNFNLVGNAGDKDIRQVASRLEQFREAFTILLSNARLKSSIPTTIIVFKNDSSYRPFKPTSYASGHFQAGEDVNYITLTTERLGKDDEPYRVIFHEYVHLMVNHTLGNAPAWFSEGLAEYYSTFNIEDDRKITLGKVLSNHVLFLRGHKLLPLSEPRLLPLRTLFAVDHSSPYYNEKDKANVFYAQSWALVHYLISGNKGQRNRQMVRFVELINNGKPTEAAFNEAFQTNYETLEKELKEYITRDTYPAHIVTFEKKLVRESEMRSTPLSEAEAQTYLGDLLLHSQRVEAESYLQHALKLDPQLAMANASMGLLRVRQGRFEEARAYLEKAVAANSENYLAHYYYAFALSRQGMDANNIVYRYAPESLATMRRELNKAIALAPQFAESYHLLAFINLVAGEQLDESIGFLKKALALSPGKSEYTFALIQIHLSRQEFKAARQLLEPLAREGEDPDMRRRAQSLLDSLTGLEEREARRKTAESNSAAAGKSKLPGQTQESREVEYDPLADLGEALRKPASGEVRVQGSLVGIDCGPKMIVLTIKTADRMVKVQTAGFEKMGFSTFTETVDREITCGLRKSPEWVVVTYKPTTEARTKNAGTAVALEFVPKEFKLKP